MTAAPNSHAMSAKSPSGDLAAVGVSIASTFFTRAHAVAAHRWPRNPEKPRLTRTIEFGKRVGFAQGAAWAYSEDPGEVEVRAFRDAALREGLLIGSSVARRMLTASRRAALDETGAPSEGEDR